MSGDGIFLWNIFLYFLTRQVLHITFLFTVVRDGINKRDEIQVEPKFSLSLQLFILNLS